MNDPMTPAGMSPPEQRGSEDERLDSLFRAYHMACEPREISPNFMPELWQKIERVQTAKFSFQKIARRFVTAAAALTLIFATFELLPGGRSSSPEFSATYVETLLDQPDAGDTLDVARPDSVDYTEEI